MNKKKPKPRKIKDHNKSDYVKMKPKHRIIYATIGTTVLFVGFILFLINIIQEEIIYFGFFSLLLFFIAILGLTSKKQPTKKEIVIDRIIENVISTAIDNII